MLRAKNGFYSLSRVKFNNNRNSKNLVTMKLCFNTLKMLSYNRKLSYRLRNSKKFVSYIQMIQGTAISLSCDLKKSSVKNVLLPAKQPVSRRYDCQWLHWILDTPSARHRIDQILFFFKKTSVRFNVVFSVLWGTWFCHDNSSKNVKIT